jgi:hypothetical protein
VAIGIVWVVVRNVIETGTEQIETGSKCNAVSVTPVSMANSSIVDDLPNEYKVTVERSAEGDDIAGVVLTFENATGGMNYVHTEAGNIAPLAVTTITVAVDDVLEPTVVSVSPYFENEAGEKSICSGKNSITIE